MAWWFKGGHGDPLIDVDARWQRLLVDWFDHWLEGADNGVMKKPGSVVSMSPTDHWWQSTWPARGASPVALHPHEGGRTAGALRLARATSGRERVTDAPASRSRSLPTSPDRPIDCCTGRRRCHSGSRSRASHRCGWRCRSTLRRATLGRARRPGTEGQYHCAQRRLGRPAENRLPPRGHGLGATNAVRDRGGPGPGAPAPTAQRTPTRAGRRRQRQEFTLRPPPGTHLRLTLSEASLDLPVLGGADALRNALRP